MIKPTDSFKEYLDHLNISELNPMQAASVAANRKNSECILLSATGSGKTLGFLLPLLEKLQAQTDSVQAIILVPSRELALQIEQVFRNLKTGFKVNSVYGGHAVSVEKNNFTHPPAVLIGTPGRVADHLSRENFNPDNIHTLILDEFDKSLEMGFQEEMSFIIGRLNGLKNRILTSATDLPAIPAFVGMTDPVKLNYLSGESKRLDIKIVRSESADKLQAFYSLICNLGRASTLVFCNHRDAVERISAFLEQNQVESEFFHGGLEQVDRERILCKFRNGSTNLLITTDLAARGLDIPDIKNVIHYQLPPKEDAFIHRNGRTARVEASGVSFLILNSEEEQPFYLPGDFEEYELVEGKRNPEAPAWTTLYIGSGKKDKINKMDIVGFLSKVGQLERTELGVIEVKDFFAYAAVKRSKLAALMANVKDQKIKGKKVKIQVAK